MTWSVAGVLGLSLLLHDVAVVMPGQVGQAGARAARQGHSFSVQATAASRTTAHVTVTLPRADASLTVEGEVVAGSGRVREVETRPLDPGRPYEYTFTVAWQPNSYTAMTRAAQVRFKAGDELTLDLTRDAPNDRATVRYIPTPGFVVEEMIRLAGVGEDDVVYEPGCGDARITRAAVQAGARRGVGIDLDPTRVAEARTRVESEHLGDRIEIRQGDALDIRDLSDASVVFLYMSDEFNLLIRPLLWRQLPVGARVVSHRFTMGDWPVDTTVTVPRIGRPEYALHLWTITQEVKDRGERESSAAQATSGVGRSGRPVRPSRIR